MNVKYRGKILICQKSRFTNALSNLDRVESCLTTRERLLLQLLLKRPHSNTVAAKYENSWSSCVMFESGEQRQRNSQERSRNLQEKSRNFQESPRNSQERRLRESRTVLPSSIRLEYISVCKKYIYLYFYLHLYLYLYFHF